MSILPNPTPLQRRILTETGNLVVIGGPGTGKTTVALAKAEEFVKHAKPECYQSVLFLSFSNAAVHRIREASRGSIPRHVLRKLTITTFHGLCYSILASHWRLIGLRKPFQLLPPEDEAILRSDLKEPALSSTLQHLEVEEGRVRFDRFAPLVVTLFERQPVIAAAYAKAFPLVIVDEYQDTSDEQETIVQFLGRNGQILYLGDPNQRIYDFVAGTRPDRLERTAARDGVSVVRLDVNHRNGATDIAQVGRAILEGVTRIPRPSSVHVWGFRDRSSQIRMLKRAIVKLEDDLTKILPPGTPTSIAIMARTNSYVQGLSTALLNTNDEWPSPFRHQVLINTDAVAIAWDAVMVLLEPDFDISHRTAEILRNAARLNRLKGDNESRIKQARKFEEWAELEEAGRLPRTARAAHELRSRIERFVESITGDPTIDCQVARDVFRQLPGNALDQLTAVLELRMPTGGISDLTGVLAERYLERGSYYGARQVAEAALLRERLELGSHTRSPRVLMTMHKSKGKQFDAVVIVDGHDRKDGNRLLYKDEQESRRLLHVAITRARFKAIILTKVYDPSPIIPRFFNE